MLNKTPSYFLHIQFLGFRYHGWQKQKDVKTVQLMVERTLSFVFKHDNFKLHGCSRTDAMVSAEHFVCEVLIKDEFKTDWLVNELNINLPTDIMVLKMEPKPSHLNIIQSVSAKTYRYQFSTGKKKSPFHAPYMAHYHGPVNTEIMMEGAKLFEGQKDFKNFAHRANSEKDYIRTVTKSELIETDVNNFKFIVEGKGFVHHQVRIMAGTLLDLGRNRITLDQVQQALEGPLRPTKLSHIAPASGLTLMKVTYE